MFGATDTAGSNPFSEDNPYIQYHYEDLNDPDLEGVGYYAHNIKAGRRQSAARTFLRAARGRANLTVMTHVHVDKVLIDERKRATGVRCRVPTGQQDFLAEREVIVCAGAILSPKLLQCSGIGPAELLQPLGIEVVQDSPEVGKRMREHLGFAMPHRLLGQRGLNWRLRGFGLALSALQYGLTRRGPLATGPYEVGAFVRASPGANRPDAQLYLSAMTFAAPRAANRMPQPTTNRFPGITIYGQLLNLTSEGSVQIRSADPDAQPIITPNWLATDHDRLAAISLVRYMRNYVRQPALSALVGEELAPGAACEADEDILAAVRERSTSGLHGVATCRMGRDPHAVVDPHLRVNGVRRLRVADCSVMPALISGNTNAPAMALGWRAADLIAAEGSPSGT